MSEIESKVKAIIVDKLGVDEAEVKPEASFTNDLGADSLDTVELIMEFEKEFGISIPDDKWSSRRSSVSLSPTTRLRRSVLLATLSHTSRRTQNKFFTKHNGCFLPEATIMLYC